MEESPKYIYLNYYLMTYTNIKDFLQKELAREGIPAEHLQP
ncbi:MAG: hypothetical protein WCJ39_03430 [bacterium]